ncbi:dolichol kinase, partial [Asbolus verrucosus]
LILFRNIIFNLECHFFNNIVPSSLFIYLGKNAIMFHSGNITKTATNVMQMSTLTIQMGLLGIVIIALSVHQFNITSPSKFYTVVIFVFIFVVLLPLQILLKSSPLLWIIDLLWDDLQTNKVVLCWTFCSVLAVLVVSNRTKEAKKSSSAVRKVFHILTVSVFIPGLLYNCSLLYLASGIILGIFFVLEILRVTNIPPLAYHLQNGFVVFSDEKDSGIIAFTPMYLLAGCALPLWIHPAPCDVTNSAIFSLLPLLSGVLTTGIGDTAASIVGSKFGYHQWHEFLKFHSTMLYVKVIMAITVTSLIEAKTDQIDNLVLPLVMYIILIV